MNKTKSFVANILVLGKTGVGKSSFINYFLGEDVEDVAAGRPVTKGYLREHISKDGDIRIFDNEGFEAKGAEAQMDAIVSLVEERNDDVDEVKDWFHTIFYCINVANARLEDAEVRFIQSLHHAISQHIHVILTHCDQVDDSKVQQMKEHLRSRLGDDNGYQIFEVVSKEWKKRNGEIVHFRGKEEIRESIFELLWADISYRISSEYASELRHSMRLYINELFDALEKILRKALKPRSVVLIATGNDSKLERELNPQMEKAEDRVEEILESTNQEFDEILLAASELYVHYKGHFSGGSRFAERVGLTADDMISEWYHLDDLLSDPVLERLFTNVMPNAAKLLESDVDNEESVLKLLGILVFGVGGAVGDLLTSRFRIRKAIEQEKIKALKSLPAPEKIQQDVEQKLLEFGHSSLDPLILS